MTPKFPRLSVLKIWHEKISIKDISGVNPLAVDDNVIVVVEESDEVVEEESGRLLRLLTMHTICFPTGPFRKERICSVRGVGIEGERRYDSFLASSSSFPEEEEA